MIALSHCAWGPSVITWCGPSTGGCKIRGEHGGHATGRFSHRTHGRPGISPLTSDSPLASKCRAHFSSRPLLSHPLLLQPPSTRATESGVRTESEIEKRGKGIEAAVASSPCGGRRGDHVVGDSGFSIAMRQMLNHLAIRILTAAGIWVVALPSLRGSRWPRRSNPVLGAWREGPAVTQREPVRDHGEGMEPSERRIPHRRLCIAIVRSTPWVEVSTT